MATAEAISVRAQDLRPFEPMRLGARTPEFARLAGSLAGLQQSEILRRAEEAAAEALVDADDDIEALALGATCLVLRDYVTAGNYPIEAGGTLYLASVLGSESLDDAQLRSLLRRQYEGARERALRDRGQLKWLQDSLRGLNQAGYAPHELLDLLNAGPPQVNLLNAAENRRGLDARGLWRCVRATWSMGPEASSPGREVAFAVVDRRLPSTPLGILQFRNVVPEINCRDHWLGIAVGQPRGDAPASGFLGLIGDDGPSAASRVGKTLDVLKRLLSCVNTEGLDFEIGENSVGLLADTIRTHRKLFDETRRTGAQGLKNEHLRILKRAQTAHDLSRGILGLERLREEGPARLDKRTLEDIDAGLTKLWHYHMGFVAMEMSICGAAPPFGPARVGKLMAALAGASPVLEAWGWDRELGQISQEVYRADVRRRVPNPGPLVVFTSGLYPGHSAQYERVRSGSEVWKKIGETTGYGSFHISFETTELLARLNHAIDGYVHVTRSFGEGSGARFRSVGRALSYLGLPDLRKHETQRPMYALPLVANPRETLLGWQEPQRLPEGDPDEIARAWWHRWLEPRAAELLNASRRSADLETTLAEIVSGVGG